VEREGEVKNCQDKIHLVFCYVRCLKRGTEQDYDN